MKISKFISSIVLCVCIVYFLNNCSEGTAPKPKGFFRIHLPKKDYRMIDTIFPYKFQYPVYARISGDPHAPNQPYWINIDFPAFKAKLHLSYKSINNNLNIFAEDAHAMVMKHIPKASSINEIRIDDNTSKVHGIIYDIQGTGAASPYQFFITDSSNHFLRGALYFNTLPNNDSLAPVIEFLKQDILHIIETTEWK